LNKFNQIIQALGDWFSLLPAEKKRAAALIGTAIFTVILTISVLVSIEMPEKEDKNHIFDRQEFFSPIPVEAVFLPDEPDFLPGVLLEREQRSSWTEDDALEHWQDPLRFGEESWREKIETAIDEFLERVP